MGTLIRDLKFAARTLHRSPWYTTAIIITLALGIGANTAVFSVLRSVLLEPLPQANAERIARLYQPNTQSATTGVSPVEMIDYRQAPSVEAIVEYHSMPFTFLGLDEPQRLQTGVVSAEWFDVMGVRPLIGRTFRPGEDQPGSEPVLVLTWEYWQRAFGGDPNVVGTSFRMNDRVHTVVGVLPRIPQYPDDNDVYMPTSSCPFRAGPFWSGNRTARGSFAFALLRRGRDIDAAVSDLGAISTRLQQEYPDAYPADRRFAVSAEPLASLMTADARPSILVLLGATGFLLLIVCANVINLGVVRMIRRQSEMSTRLALGADRVRIARQLVTESMVLSVAGGALGLLVAHGLLIGVGPFLSRFTPRAYEIDLDGGVLLFTAAVSIAAGVIAGLLPALTRLRAAGSETRTTSGPQQMRLRNSLVVAQVAVSLVLLVCAGLMIRSQVIVERTSPGFDPAHVLTARLDLNWTRYDNIDLSTGFLRSIEQRVAAVPGVERVSFASTFPLNGDPAQQIAVTIEGAEDSRAPTSVAVSAVTSDYFDVLGVPVLRGRALADYDSRRETEPTFVATLTTAQRLWGDQDPIGRRVSLDGGQTWGTVIGVVGDLRQELEADAEAMLFVHQYRFSGLGSRLLIRTGADRHDIERRVRTAIAELDRDQPVTDVQTIEDYRRAALAPRRVTTALLASFAILALIITAVGLGGLISFSVAERRAELGIRIALGAGRARVLGTITAQAVLLTGIGIVMGGILAVIAARYMAGLLFGVPPTDAATYSVMAVLLLVVASIAGLVPARQATSIEPASILRGG